MMLEALQWTLRLVNVLQRLLRHPDDLLSSLYHSLQVFMVHDGAVLIPHSHAAGQDTLYDVIVEATAVQLGAVSR